MHYELLLQELAARYENADFLTGDPSWFMHQVEGTENQETMAFIAASLSYGSRKQFLPKIQHILDLSGGKPYDWVCSGRFANDIADDDRCFYRLYTNRQYRHFLLVTSKLLSEYGSLGEFVGQRAGDTLSAIKCLCAYFAQHECSVVIPKDTVSACKRLCMFMRWMVRTGSPVDLGLWTFISPSSLIIPLDTHVLQEAMSLQLISSRNATMSVALKLTDTLSRVFPGDPTKADFALFGYGVDKSAR